MDNITGYRIYWGSDETTKLSPIPIFPQILGTLIDKNVDHQEVAIGTALPTGANFFLIYIVDGVNEYPVCLAIPIETTQLTEGIWADGSITTDTVGREQWYKFTATAETQWIHFSPGTLRWVYMQLYDTAGVEVGSSSDLSWGNTIVSRTVTSGQEYYLRVWPYFSGNTGTYRIGFNRPDSPPLAITLPTQGVIQLTEDIWSGGNSGQWYKFTATAETQWIHFSPGSLDNVYVRVYDSAGVAVESSSYLSSSTTRVSRTVTSGQEYYLGVYSGNTGTYQIGFNNRSVIPPDTTITQLNEDTWADGSLTTDTPNSEQWYKFTATASTQWIHFSPGSLDYAGVQLYDSAGVEVGSSSDLSTWGNTIVSRTVTSGQEYYLRVWPYSSGNTGTYRIGFNRSIGSSTITLNEDTWADGNITTDTPNSEQWYKFTATAETQWIHFSPGSLDYVYVQLYDSAGIAVGSSSDLSTWGNTRVSRTVTSGQEYYLRVSLIYGDTTGTYRIGFNRSFRSPSTITLNEDTWADGSLTTDTPNMEQWYKFTATAETQWIHFSPGTLSSVSVQLYNSDGIYVVGTNLYDWSTRNLLTVTSGQEYYLMVSGSTGTYRIGFNRSDTPPMQ